MAGGQRARWATPVVGGYRRRSGRIGGVLDGLPTLFVVVLVLHLGRDALAEGITAVLVRAVGGQERIAIGGALIATRLGGVLELSRRDLVSGRVLALEAMTHG